jgi:hypothetical protein
LGPIAGVGDGVGGGLRVRGQRASPVQVTGLGGGGQSGGLLLAGGGPVA